MARVTFLCGPLGDPVLHPLLQRWRELIHSRTFGSTLWLCPNYRTVEELLPRLLGDSQGCLAPRVLTIHDFADEIVRNGDLMARPISHLQRRLMAEALVIQLHQKGHLSHFQGVVDTRGFTETVYALFGELKRSEIRPEQLLTAASEKATFVETSTLKDKQSALLYKAYHDVLRRHHLYDLEGRVWYAKELLQEGLKYPFQDLQAIFVYGFATLTSTEQQTLEACARWTEEIWVTLPDEQDAERQELFCEPRRVLAALGSLGPEVIFSEKEQPSAKSPLPARQDYLPKAQLWTPKDTNEPPVQTLQSSTNEVLLTKNPVRTAHKNPLAELPTPPGLHHLQTQLFRPRRQIVKGHNATGIGIMEAPEVVGEVRLVARRIRELLHAGVPPDAIMVILRDLAPYASLIDEVFEEYGIPIDLEGAEPLIQNPTIATLLRILRVPDEGYVFGQVTSLLRSNYFRPDWPEVDSNPEVVHQSEALLRLLDEPRGRDAYLAAVVRWAENPPPGLEDEQVEESRRQRKHQLAKQCRRFLERFLHCWDDAPDRGTWRVHVRWLRRLCSNLGIEKAANEYPRDKQCLERFWAELEKWERLDKLIHGGGHTVERHHFQKMLTALASQAGLARGPRGPGKVRVLSAEVARSLSADHVFVMGLGERSFPRLATPDSFFDEQERQAFHQVGVPLSCLADLLPQEMLLFYQIVTKPKVQLTLSYPAIDRTGQELLPSSFLTSVLDCFELEAVPALRRNMLIEGYDRDPPMSLAEYRVQAACSIARGGPKWPLPAQLNAQMVAARDVSQHRFRNDDHSIYDGLFRDKKIIDQVAQLFSPDRILSPTALEYYVACPFKFFLRHVLRLQPLEEPQDEIESTERGLTFHRALSRLHQELQTQGVHQPTEMVDHEVLTQLDRAIEESTTQTSPAARMLWAIEGQRLRRNGNKYRGHWTKFVKPWVEKDIFPRPTYFEIGFGLPPAEGEVMYEPLVIIHADREVRISGRIDRVDVADLPGGDIGFWIIDYKTGSGSYYTSSDLKEFRKLQLTLYALAVEKVMLTNQTSRPLGLAYWLVTDTGPKNALPGRSQHAWLDNSTMWENVRNNLEHWVVELVSRIRSGEFALKPRSEHCTQTCDFGQICRISQSRSVVVRKSWNLPLPVIDQQ
ncbi:MAG: PD-(D/E)XK nuclease family protein [Gemmataceae bacterium]